MPRKIKIGQGKRGKTLRGLPGIERKGSIFSRIPTDAYALLLVVGVAALAILIFLLAALVSR